MILDPSLDRDKREAAVRTVTILDPSLDRDKREAAVRTVTILDPSEREAGGAVTIEAGIAPAPHPAEGGVGSGAKIAILLDRDEHEAGVHTVITPGSVLGGLESEAKIAILLDRDEHEAGVRTVMTPDSALGAIESDSDLSGRAGRCRDGQDNNCPVAGTGIGV